MKFRNMLLAGGVVVMAIGASGCGRDEAKGGAGGTGGAGATGGAGGAGGAGGDAGPGVSSARFAHLSPDAPAVDVCLLPAGAQDPNANAIGPILQKSLNNASGLSFGQVSSYAEVPAGQYSVRLVAAGAQDCATALQGTTDQAGVAFRANTFHTAAVMGEVAPAGGGAQTLEIGLFDDDLSPEAGQAKVRFIHASPDAGSIDVGTVDAQATFTPLFSGVSFAQAGKSKAGNDYASEQPLDNATIVVRPAGQDSDLLSVPNVTLDPDRVVTIFAVGNHGGQPKPLRLLVCQDERQGVPPAGQGGAANATSCKLMP